MISAAPLLAQYLETHPFANDPEAPLWLTDSTNFKDQRLGWTRWNKILKSAWKRSGIPKRRLYSRMLRHGSATENAKYLSDSELKVRHGWSMGSRMPAVYVHLSGKDSDDKMAAIYSGKEVKAATPTFVPVICPRCKKESSPGMTYCPRCGTPLTPSDPNSSIDVEELRKELRELKEMFAHAKPLGEVVK